jgi:hypothetical protein
MTDGPEINTTGYDFLSSPNQLSRRRRRNILQALSKERDRISELRNMRTLLILGNSVFVVGVGLLNIIAFENIEKGLDFGSWQGCLTAGLDTIAGVLAISGTRLASHYLVGVEAHTDMITYLENDLAQIRYVPDGTPTHGMMRLPDEGADPLTNS